MHELLNVLYVLTQGTVLHLDHDAVRINVDNEPPRRVPLLRLSGIVIFGRVTMTPFLIQRCAEDGRSLVWLDRNGRFKARVQGPTRGNVLLRRAQHLALSDVEHTIGIARQMVAAKVQNCRLLLMRASRDASDGDAREQLTRAADHLATVLGRLHSCGDLDSVRGCEGEAARDYFAAMRLMVRVDPDDFAPAGRTRRPPRDPMNALLSFLYALLRSECASALEAIGLDPQIGYLHALRSGRPALALDLMEELRPVVADRLALKLVNRRQLNRRDFEKLPGGAVVLTEEGRKTVIRAYQARKSEELHHRVIQQSVPLGLVPHVQARLLARHLRGDLAHYPPFLHR
jgi:CRISP-associated protein Cas1